MRRLVTIAATAGVLAVAGCGDGDDDDAGSPAANAANARTAGATLRAELTRGLADQTYLTGVAVAEAVRGGTEQEQFRAAVDAAKESATALAETISAPYGARPRGELERLWRDQVDAFAEYATAKLAADEAGVSNALRTIDELRAAVSTRLGQTIGDLDRRKTAEDLRLQLQALIAASDAIVEKSPTAYEQLGKAGARAPIGADRLAEAIADDKSDRFTAKPDGPAAAMRAGLTARLVADSYLTLLRANAIARFGATSATAKGAGKAVDANAVSLSQLLSSVYGEDGGQRALKLWRELASLLSGYSSAKVREDDVAARAALTGLNVWRKELSTLLQRLNAQFERARLTAVAGAAIDARTAAIRADSTHSVKTYERLQEAGAKSAELATAIAGAISAQYPDKFGAE